MKTSSFFSYQGAGRISIARATPRGMSGLFTYRPLAPGPWFNSVSEPRYRELYFEQLANLNAGQVVTDLDALTAGAEPVLLCWERPPLHASNWCHRTMVAEWFKHELGLEIVEIDP